jgi:hypothetical protein
MPNDYSNHLLIVEIVLPLAFIIAASESALASVRTSLSVDLS